jgi:hypothetical protein
MATSLSENRSAQTTGFAKKRSAQPTTSPVLTAPAGRAASGHAHEVGLVRRGHLGQHPRRWRLGARLRRDAWHGARKLLRSHGWTNTPLNLLSLGKVNPTQCEALTMGEGNRRFKLRSRTNRNPTLPLCRPQLPSSSGSRRPAQAPARPFCRPANTPLPRHDLPEVTAPLPPSLRGALDRVRALKMFTAKSAAVASRFASVAALHSRSVARCSVPPSYHSDPRGTGRSHAASTTTSNRMGSDTATGLSGTGPGQHQRGVTCRRLRSRQTRVFSGP